MPPSTNAHPTLLHISFSVFSFICVSFHHPNFHRPYSFKNPQPLHFSTSLFYRWLACCLLKLCFVFISHSHTLFALAALALAQSYTCNISSPPQIPNIQPDKLTASRANTLSYTRVFMCVYMYECVCVARLYRLSLPSSPLAGCVRFRSLRLAEQWRVATPLLTFPLAASAQYNFFSIHFMRFVLHLLILFLLLNATIFLSLRQCVRLNRKHLHAYIHTCVYTKRRLFQLMARLQCKMLAFMEKSATFLQFFIYSREFVSMCWRISTNFALHDYR